jgi:hypothetical protein
VVLSDVFQKIQSIFDAPDECFDEYHYALANSFPVVSRLAPMDQVAWRLAAFVLFRWRHSGVR